MSSEDVTSQKVLKIRSTVGLYKLRLYFYSRPSQNNNLKKASITVVGEHLTTSGYTLNVSSFMIKGGRHP